MEFFQYHVWHKQEQKQARTCKCQNENTHYLPKTKKRCVIHRYCLLLYHNHDVIARGTSKTRTARDYSNISNYSKTFNLIISDIDECSQGSHGCHANATCNNTQGSYNCTYLGEYVGSGKYCKVKGGSYLSEIHFILERIGKIGFCMWLYFYETELDF